MVYWTHGRILRVRFLDSAALPFARAGIDGVFLRMLQYMDEANANTAADKRGDLTPKLN